MAFRLGTQHKEANLAYVTLDDLFSKIKRSNIVDVKGVTVTGSSFSCSPDSYRPPGRSRGAFRKMRCSAKLAYSPINRAIPAKSRTTNEGPFGELIRSTGPMAKANPIRFSTKYQDDESDLLYYGYRHYKANTGAWINRDPLTERGGKNLYSFVRNNPIGLVDRDGRQYNPWPSPG